MPVCLNFYHPDHEWKSRAQWPSDSSSAEFPKHSARCINIGLVNNMADGALAATERQFLSLLDSASEGMLVRLSLYSLPGVLRSGSAARRMRNFYSSVEHLRDAQLDALIVTGREPLTPNLADEPYWKSFTEVLEWARENTFSTVWSCLAAHAAVLHMDGIGRIRSDEKQCGVFECAQVASHPLTAGAQSRFQLPHSRWNGLPEDELTACGYSVLTRSADVGVDTFIQQQKSLFVFFQGHPEYESDTLLLEYRRDVGRYLRGESESYPLMPRNYFDSETAAALRVLQNRVSSQSREELLAEVAATLGTIEVEDIWRSTSVCMYRNWLEYLCDQKELHLQGREIAADLHRADGSAPLLAAAI
jgi:homoserine O-succinyltransferase